MERTGTISLSRSAGIRATRSPLTSRPTPTSGDAGKVSKNQSTESGSELNTMTDSAHRDELVLDVTQRLSGAITMPVVQALYPDVHRSVLVRLLARMSRPGGPLIALWQLDGRSRVWLTSQPTDSHHQAGIKRWLNADAQEAMRARDRHPERWQQVRPTLPITFIHDQIAGMLVAGYGHEHGMTFDSELLRSRHGKTPDGRAWIGPDEVLDIEVERMVRQPISRWSKDGGLIETMVMTMQSIHANTRHLVVAPSRHLPLLVQNVERMLHVRGYSEMWRHDDAQRGYWTLPLEDVWGKPTWNPAGRASLQVLTGLRDRYEASPIRQRALERDLAAKKEARIRHDQEQEQAQSRRDQRRELQLAWGRMMLMDNEVDQQRKRRRHRERLRRARRRAERRSIAAALGGTHEVGGEAPGVPRSGAG